MDSWTSEQHERWQQLRGAVRLTTGYVLSIATVSPNAASVASES